MIYSVIIPAYNEADLLPQTLAALKSAMNAVAMRGEVIVVDNNSTDKTAEIARGLGACVVCEPINQISRARNTGAAHARGRYLIFLDADTLITPELLQTALDQLTHRHCCGGGATVIPDTPLPPVFEKSMDFWNWLSVTFNLAAGSFIFCLRETFEAVGGFSHKVFAGEEIIFSAECKKWCGRRGLAFRILQEFPVVTSTRKLDWYSHTKILSTSLLLILFPVAVRFRRLCRFWYERPGHKGR